MNISQLQKTLKQKRQAITKLQAECYNIEQQLEGRCDHSECESYQWEHDNGYGLQTQKHGKRCVFCGWVDLWNRGQFDDPADLT